jgi:hypothetical protein
VRESRKAEDAAGLRRFQAVPSYKESTVEWFGSIPAHWKVKKWRYCTGRILFTESANDQGAISGKYLALCARICNRRPRNKGV